MSEVSPIPRHVREEIMDNGERRFTDDPFNTDPWEDVDEDVRMEQDNDYIAEQMAEQFDNEGE